MTRETGKLYHYPQDIVFDNRLGPGEKAIGLCGMSSFRRAIEKILQDLFGTRSACQIKIIQNDLTDGNSLSEYTFTNSSSEMDGTILLD